MAGIGNIAKYLHLLPILGALIAVWQDYGTRGLAGLQADLNSISFAGIQAKASAIIGAVVMIAIGIFVRKSMGGSGYNKYIGVVIETVAVYVGTRQILDAIRAGRGYGKGAGIDTRTTQSNPYNPMGMTAGR